LPPLTPCSAHILSLWIHWDSIQVAPGSPAAIAGLAASDVITHVDGRNVEAVTHEALAKAMKKNAKNEIQLKVQRRWEAAVIQVHTVPVRKTNNSYVLRCRTKVRASL
jgi:C-terminal processing protease CtpA/Prc